MGRIDECCCVRVMGSVYKVWMVEMDLPVEYEEVDGGFRSTEEEEGDKRV